MGKAHVYYLFNQKLLAYQKKKPEIVGYFHKASLKSFSNIIFVGFMKSGSDTIKGEGDALCFRFFPSIVRPLPPLWYQSHFFLAGGSVVVSLFLVRAYANV